MIIFLNGVSSSGKTSIGRALQYLCDKPLLLFGIDDFFLMMPKQYLEFGPKAAKGFPFERRHDQEGTLIHVDQPKEGTFGDKVMKIMPHLVVDMAAEGIDVIVDEVLLEDENLRTYVQALKNYTVYFVGVYCSLKIMEEREILRGDRPVGLSRDQINRVHGPTRIYDMTVDTTITSAFDCAQHILDFTHHTVHPVGFKKLEELLG